MQGVHIIKQCPVYRSARVMQTEGLFDVEAKSKDVREWDVHLPIHEKEWKIGLIVGPSGCGKTVLITEMFPDNIVSGLSWPEEKSILDAFPNGMGIKEITSLLSSVGFSSPPSWLKPYHVLSNGEKFRVQMARVLAEKRDLAVVDEYTSVVDRTVAQIGSVAVSKTIRKGKGQFIAVTCHYDVIDWLQPDWVYCPIENRFEWRFLQPRPAIPIDIIRVHHSAWEYFKAHHYLTKSIHKGSRCFVGVYNGRPAAFAAVMQFPHIYVKNAFRGHRLVCLPDFQGVGIGSAMAQFCGMLIKGIGKRFYIRSSHPAEKQRVIHADDWRVINQPNAGIKTSMGTGIENTRKHRMKARNNRIYRPVISAEYMGHGYPAEEAAQMWGAQAIRI